MPKGKKLNNESKPPSNNLITPPNVLDNDQESFLLVNVTDDELTALSKFLPWARNVYNFYLYNNNYSDTPWLSIAAKKSSTILVARKYTTASLLEPMLDHISKIVWFGEQQEYVSPTEFLAKYERTTSK